MALDRGPDALLVVEQKDLLIHGRIRGLADWLICQCACIPEEAQQASGFKMANVVEMIGCLNNISLDRSSLRINEIDVWRVSLVDDFDMREFVELLDHEERARAASFLFDHHRTRFIQSHVALRLILARYVGCDPASVSFVRNRYKKPRLKMQVRAADLDFNLSRSGRCCLVAIRIGSEVGIDVEQVRKLPEAADIARKWFTPSEARRLASLVGVARQLAFLSMWTHREAVTKALGTSLEKALDRMEFALDPGGALRLVSWCGNRSVANKWSVRRIELDSGYVGALASLKPFEMLNYFDCQAANR